MRQNQRLYLASRSPRRRVLLAQIGAAFDPIVIDGEAIDTTRQADEAAGAYVDRLARSKAEYAWRLIVERNLMRQPVLAANTSVEIDGQVVGKPRDEYDAQDLLRHLSGKHHRVLTAVTVADGKRMETRLSVSEVLFGRLGDAQIRAYVASGEALDQAGAYAINGRAGQFVQHVAGSYSGILGLPLFETAELLRSFGFPL